MDLSDEALLSLPHPVSLRHPQMPAAERAAQFAPFAALSGYEDALKRTGLEEAGLREDGMAHEVFWEDV